MNRFLRSLLATIPAVVLYAVALPWCAVLIDQRLGLVWRLPFWLERIGLGAVVLGTAIAACSAWVLTIKGNGTPNPLMPPAALVVSGPFRYSRNPLMLGGWLFGAGLACMLRSASLLAMVGLVVLAGTVYLKRVEEPGLIRRFGEAYREYAQRTPRWLLFTFVVGMSVAGLSTVRIESAVAVNPPTPAILVQIRCHPGTAEMWRELFDLHMLPAIRETVARGETFTDFRFVEAALPAQTFDFMLVFTGKSFAQLDRRRPFPHYQALFRREGTLRASVALREMISYEESVSVTLVRLGEGWR